jgi:UDP-N-acetylglucosamine transferase subunit ALG13
VDPHKRFTYNKILISPLDWGLGHATRLVPLIHYFLSMGCQVTIAASGQTKTLLRQEFPDLIFMQLPGYEITYAVKGRNFTLKMLFQVPRIIKAIVREHLWLRRHQHLHRWDAVISDNRYGLFHRNCASIFITHQINIRAEKGKMVDRIIRHLNHRLIRNFTYCWIPDDPSAKNLSGELSHGNLPPNAVFIGPLSRFESLEAAVERLLLILISGPEPQRTHFETLLQRQLKNHVGEVVIVRGLPGHHRLPDPSGQVTWINHLSAADLEGVISRAGLVICRSGYSTIMDLARTRKRAVLVPTPGQTEQLYLAQYLMESQWFPAFRQETFSLPEAIKTAEAFPYKNVSISFDRHREVIRRFISGELIPSSQNVEE